MKKLGVIIALVIAMGLLMGCGTAAQRSEFYQHDTMFKNWDHWKYSWGGYKHPETAATEKSKDQNWWGIPVEDGQVK